MKLKEGFVLREVAGQNVVLPSGDLLDLNMLINLNDTGKFLWECLEKEADEGELVCKLLEEYDVDEITAKNAVAHFVDQLNEYGLLD